MRHEKKKPGKVWPRHRENEQLTETVPEEIQLLDIINKDYKSTTINTYKELKETLKNERRIENDVLPNKEYQ